MQRKAFDEWALDQDVEYTLVATVNGEVVARSTSVDVNDVVSESENIEEKVAQYLNDEYNDEPDYDLEVKYGV